MRFMYPGFGSVCGGVVVCCAAGVAFVTRDQELPPCQTEPVPNGSKTHLLLIPLPDHSLQAERYNGVRLPPDLHTFQQRPTISAC